MLQTVISVDPLTESNCYILAEDSKCVVIDPGESERLLRTLDEYGWEPELILLTHEHCDHMAGLDALRETTTKIWNIRAYLLTALYNAPLTIGPYYAAAVRHDFG